MCSEYKVPAKAGNLEQGTFFSFLLQDKDC